MGPLTALVAYYDRVRAATLGLATLGIKGAREQAYDRAKLPPPDLAEFTTRTKDPHVLCVRDGASLIKLKAPCSYSAGRELTHTLVRAGVHPLDIIVATRRSDDDWVIRTAVDHLYWTNRDQQALDAEEQ